MLDNFLKSKLGRIIISIIWGLGLACLFRRVCKGKQCLVIKGTNPDKVRGKIFKYNDGCYVYDTYNVSCSSNNKNIPVN